MAFNGDLKITEHPPMRKPKIGGWDQTLEYDAHLTYRGLRWVRVHNGFGGKGDREDWVLELPESTRSVGRYADNEGWGVDQVLPMKVAMDDIIAQELRRLIVKIPEEIQRLSRMIASQGELEEALAQDA